MTMDDEGNTNLQLNLYNGQLVLEAPNGLLPNRSNGQVYKLGIYTGSIRGSAYYEEAVLNADTRPLAKAEESPAINMIRMQWPFTHLVLAV